MGAFGGMISSLLSTILSIEYRSRKASRSTKKQKPKLTPAINWNKKSSIKNRLYKNVTPVVNDQMTYDVRLALIFL